MSTEIYQQEEKVKERKGSPNKAKLESPFIVLVAYRGGQTASREEGAWGSLNAWCSFLFYPHV